MTDVAAVPISELLHDAEKGGCHAGIIYLQQMRLRKMVVPLGNDSVNSLVAYLALHKWEYDTEVYKFYHEDAQY